MQAKTAADKVTVLAATEYSADAQSSAVKLPGFVNGFVFELDCTAAADAADDYCDVYIQTRVDGTNWVDVVHFTQLIGNGGTKRYYAKITAGAAMTMFENATALGAAAVRDILGDDWRVDVDITDGAGTHTFTIAVYAMPM